MLRPRVFIAIAFTLLIILLGIMFISSTNPYSSKLTIAFRSAYEDQMRLGFKRSPDVNSGKAVVYRHNGKTLERIPDFCTWTVPMDCASLKIPDYDPMIIFIHDSRDDPGLSGKLKKDGLRDPENVRIVMNELVKYPDAGFLDFGSHIAVYGLSIAKALGRKVVTVDPMIANAMRVCKSIELNGLNDNMTVIYNAISNEIVKVNFNIPVQHIGATTIVKNKANTDNCDQREHYSIMLDDIIPVVPFKSAVMKLDVEKSEYLAISGGLKFLKEIHVHSILMEWYNIVYTADATPLVKLMKDLNYVPYIPYDTGKHVRVKFEDYKTWQHRKNALDILWVKEE